MFIKHVNADVAVSVDKLFCKVLTCAKGGQREFNMGWDFWLWRMHRRFRIVPRASPFFSNSL